MSAEIIDLAERRQIIALRAEVAKMERLLAQAKIESDPGLVKRLALIQAAELEQRYATLLDRARPVLVELFELQAVTLDPPVDKLDCAIHVATVSAAVLRVQGLVGELPERLARRRATLPEEHARIAATWGPEVLELREEGE